MKMPVSDSFMNAAFMIRKHHMTLLVIIISVYSRHGSTAFVVRR